MNRITSILRKGLTTRTILIGLMPAGMVFFVACGGGSPDTSAADAQIAALQAQLAGQCQAGQASASVVAAGGVNPDGTPNCEYNAVPSASTTPGQPAAVSPSCQLLAQFQTMQCKFNALAAMPDCTGAASNLNQTLQAQLLQQQQTGATGTAAAANSSSSAQIAYLQSQLAGSQTGNKCSAELNKAFQDFQTFQNGLFANTQQGCQYLQDNLTKVYAQLQSALTAQGQTTQTAQLNTLGTALLTTTNGSQGPCQVANTLQQYLPVYLTAIQAGGSNSLGQFAGQTGTYNLTSLTGGSAAGSTAGSLAGATTGTGTGSTIGALQLTGAGTTGSAAGSSYASQATTTAGGSSIGSVLAGLTGTGTSTNSGAIRSGNGEGGSYDFMGAGNGSAVASRGAIIGAGGSGAGGGNSGVSALVDQASNKGDNFFASLASEGSTDGIDGVDNKADAGGRVHDRSLLSASRRPSATAARPAGTNRGAITVSGVRKVYNDQLPDGGTFQTVY